MLIQVGNYKYKTNCLQMYNPDETFLRRLVRAMPNFAAVIFNIEVTSTLGETEIAIKDFAQPAVEPIVYAAWLGYRPGDRPQRGEAVPARAYKWSMPIVSRVGFGLAIDVAGATPKVPSSMSTDELNGRVLFVNVAWGYLGPEAVIAPSPSI